MSALLPDFAAARVLVAGDVMLDRYWIGPTSRISPEAPVPIVRIRRDETRPGGAANVALNIASLGAQASLLGVVGRDEAARLLADETAARGVRAQFVSTEQAPTITKLRVLSRNQQLIRLDFEEALEAVGAFDAAELAARYAEALGACRVVVLSDYGKGTLRDVAALVAAARAQGKAVLVDPKGSDWQRYRGATLLTPNLAEFEAVAGRCRDEAELVAKAEQLRAELRLDALLITRSEHGMTLIEPGQAPLHIPTEAREVFDVTGAGDTVIATLAAALAAGSTLATACRLANTAAGIVVGKLGTATVSRDELRAALSGRRDVDGGVVDEAVLLQAVARARAAGKRIVMTNGVFDVMHVGHARYLEDARRLGDLLIVAVNDDDSVRRLKGPTRPLNATADRMALLAALRCVDLVVPFAEDTPARLIGRVLPDLLVKGGDYRPEQIAGYDAVTANGGRVLVLPFHDGYSTTSLIDKARR
ncbi:bifunctional D-glycero-beta-D-manno-heptose-7-phosphate kinase/D-glycero-beta-D-manno-heptose 1-phosphate adenylyltransferase HldE [Solimonas variicoloris]|uniref:bifunctional D-glycero-beta-D-manno-heptose-7-phosphate kinase/D-glycero-beta-D-manno-heptose 1-phosphate adenylyltransferase HldE n=1 Tax=Solimonas variicoloris TaxID=254408 RepID=UPI00036C47FE|nr:bifunctional D-glycero-beta-D-manno-heptose-7-phosphate kinase/D-glycero-beta-D-manno-heptose 1-phosphate adenylyltransferase HldE [Solimonas variicoloris]